VDAKLDAMNDELNMQMV